LIEILAVFGFQAILVPISQQVYYLADEIRSTYRGMMIAIPPKE
jgi:hypothetical protein